MKKIKDMSANERPREKLLAKGPKFLADWELLAVILGRGSQKNDVITLSKKIVKVIDEKGLDFIAEDILHIDGIGNARATSISASLEFVRRRIKPEGLKIRFPAEIFPLIRHYGDRKQEHFICASLNAANEVMNVRVVTIGLVNKSQVHPREVFADVIAERASAVIVAHNHPHGGLEPSPEDIQVTKRLKEAAKILGLNLLDHIIFNSKGYHSFSEKGEL